MDKKKDRTPAPVVGGSSLLVIFSVLCLTVFALLCLAQVQAGGRLSKASAEAVAAYYRADAQAQEILAHLRSGRIPQGVSVNGMHCFYECPISQTQTLVVEVECRGEEYTVLRWQVESSVDWEADDTLLVWDGESTGREEYP